MTPTQFDAAYRAFCERRPFREFASGHQAPVGHPEAVRNEDTLYVMRRTDGGHAVFAAESVARLLGHRQITTS